MMISTNVIYFYESIKNVIATNYNASKLNTMICFKIIFNNIIYYSLGGCLK